jgi:hypothetical protein
VLTTYARGRLKRKVHAAYGLRPPRPPQAGARSSGVSGHHERDQPGVCGGHAGRRRGAQSVNNHLVLLKEILASASDNIQTGKSRAPMRALRADPWPTRPVAALEMKVARGD